MKKDWHEVIRVTLQEDAFGYVVRCRFQNNASEEVASLFHANKEVKNANKNNIKSLKINGLVTDDTKKIKEEVTNYLHALHFSMVTMMQI